MRLYATILVSNKFTEDLVGLGLVRYGRLGTVGFDTDRLGTVRCGEIRFGRYGKLWRVRFGEVRFGEVRYGLAGKVRWVKIRFGLARFDEVWSGRYG